MMFPKPQQYRAVVVSTKRLDGKVQDVRFRVTGPLGFEYLAGQYCSFFVGTATRRTYSLSTQPGTDEIGVCVNTIPGGLGSQWLLGLTPGDTVEFLGPLGRFVVDKASPKKKVFIATGTGISPIHSMILDVLLNHEPSTSGHALALYWGLRYEEDIFWKEEFENLSKKYTKFQFHLTLSRSGPSWTGMQGRVTELVEVHEKDISANEYYLCGSRQMIYDMRAMLLSHSIPEEQIKSEHFY